MNNQANLSMLLTKGLEPVEQKKIELLDPQISQKFQSAGLVARLCQGSGDGQLRLLIFFSDILGIDKVGSVSANNFLYASEKEAVAMINLSS